MLLVQRLGAQLVIVMNVNAHVGTERDGLRQESMRRYVGQWSQDCRVQALSIFQRLVVQNPQSSSQCMLSTELAAKRIHAAT